MPKLLPRQSAGHRQDDWTISARMFRAEVPSGIVPGRSEPRSGGIRLARAESQPWESDDIRASSAPSGAALDSGRSEAQPTAGSRWAK